MQDCTSEPMSPSGHCENMFRAQERPTPAGMQSNALPGSAAPAGTSCAEAPGLRSTPPHTANPLSSKPVATMIWPHERSWATLCSLCLACSAIRPLTSASSASPPASVSRRDFVCAALTWPENQARASMPFAFTPTRTRAGFLDLSHAAAAGRSATARAAWSAVFAKAQYLPSAVNFAKRSFFFFPPSEITPSAPFLAPTRPARNALSPPAAG